MDPDQEQALAIHMALATQAQDSGTPGVVLGIEYRKGNALENARLLVTGPGRHYVMFYEFNALNVPQQMQARLLHSRNFPSSSETTGA